MREDNLREDKSFSSFFFCLSRRCRAPRIKKDSLKKVKEKGIMSDEDRDPDIELFVKVR